MVADGHGTEGGDCDAGDLGDDQRRTLNRHSGAALAEHAAQRAEGVEPGDDGRDDPPVARREVVVGQVVDPLVLDHDHAFDLEHLQDGALPDQEARERDHERRHADLCHDRSLSRADRADDEDSNQYREPSGHGGDERVRKVVVAAGQLELGDRQGRDPAQVPDREVDLAQQEDEDDAVGEHGDARHLDDDVVEVVRSEEDRRLVPEEEDDDRQADDDGQDAEIARPDVVEDPPAEAPRFILRRQSGGRVLPDDLDFGLGRHGTGASVASGIPATFVGTPAVIACTISCCVVFARS